MHHPVFQTDVLSVINNDLIRQSYSTNRSATTSLLNGEEYERELTLGSPAQ